MASPLSLSFREWNDSVSAKARSATGRRARTFHKSSLRLPHSLGRIFMKNLTQLCPPTWCAFEGSMAQPHYPDARPFPRRIWQSGATPQSRTNGQVRDSRRLGFHSTRYEIRVLARISTDQAAAVQLCLRVALELQILTVKSRLLPGENTWKQRCVLSLMAGRRLVNPMGICRRAFRRCHG